MIPSLAVVRIQHPRSRISSQSWNENRTQTQTREFGLWLPLFLLWIPALLLAPLVLLVLLVACFVWNISFWRSIAVFWGILCGLPGTHVHVRADRAQVQVRIL
jgi:hypothetical protein